MKNQIVTLLMLGVIFLTACKKDAIGPSNRTSLDYTPTTAANAPVVAGSVVNPDTVAINVNGYLRLQLGKDSINTDNILIDFNPASKAAYLRGEDAPTLQGFGKLSLASYSSDHVALAINVQPLINRNLTIGLNVNAKSDGVYQLSLLAIKSIPQIFDVWLIDQYKKDSVNLRSNPNYSFSLSMADTSTFGSHRFSIAILENKALQVQLVDISTAKMTDGADISWKTVNEENYTSFTVERSVDKGATFSSLTSFVSSAAAAYSYVDKTPASGTNQYRLKLLDLNGNLSYSKVVSVNN